MATSRAFSLVFGATRLSPGRCRLKNWSTRVARHDEAWRQLDENPTVDHQTGQPHSFLNDAARSILPPIATGPNGLRGGIPYGGFLVAMHYQGFFNQRFGLDQGAHRPLRRRFPNRARIQEYLSAMEMMRGRFVHKRSSDNGFSRRWATSPETTHAYLLLQVVDVISLFLCLGPGRTWPLGIVPKTDGRLPNQHGTQPGPKPGTHVVDPWPFEKPSTSSCDSPVRRIPDRHYTSDTDLRQTITGSLVKETATP